MHIHQAINSANTSLLQLIMTGQMKKQKRCMSFKILISQPLSHVPSTCNFFFLRGHLFCV